jgi:hypothetical protein
MAPVRLDPTQRIVDLSFGNRIALIYAFGGRPNAFIPPQLVLSLTAPVSIALINGETAFDATGLGSGGASIGNDLTAEMLQAYRAWRYPSVQVYSAGHADLVGIHCAVALNLAKFGGSGPVIDIALSAAGIGPNFNRPEVAVSTYRGLGYVELLSIGSGNAVTDAAPVSHKTARRFTPGSITGSINLQTLAVTLVGESSSGGGGGGNEG